MNKTEPDNGNVDQPTKQANDSFPKFIFWAFLPVLALIIVSTLATGQWVYFWVSTSLLIVCIIGARIIVVLDVFMDSAKAGSYDLEKESSDEQPQ